MANHSPILVIQILIFSAVFGHLDVRYEWKYIDYVWENDEQKQSAMDAGDYDYTQIFTIDVDRARDGRVFVTTPKQNGVPASLSIVSDQNGDGGPLLKPYPNWSWHVKGNCDAITSVFRVTIDNCNRMWVLDTGKHGNDQVCEPQLIAFDLLDDLLVKRIKIPLEYAQSSNDPTKGLLITPAVETKGRHCEQTWIYMADSDGGGLVISNGEHVRRLTDKSFDPEENHVNFTIAGESFQLADGLFSLALQPRTHPDYPTRLYYRPLASLTQYYVSTKQIERGSFLKSSLQPNYVATNYTFPSQVSAQAFSSNGILFMGLTNPPAIICWNSDRRLIDRNVVTVAGNEETLQFTSGLKVRGRELWVFTNRYQKIVTGTQNFGEINFRILVESNIRKLVRNTACGEVGRQGGY